MALIGSLSTNEDVEDAVRGGHSNTDAGNKDIGLTLLVLFVCWQDLPAKLKFKTPQPFLLQDSYFHVLLDGRDF